LPPLSSSSLQPPLTSSPPALVRHPHHPRNHTGISRDSLHKRRATGGRKKHWRKKKK